MLGCFFLIMQYSAFFYMSFILTFARNTTNQIKIAKNSLACVVNNLHEALLIKSDGGCLSYCNFIGLKVVKAAGQKQGSSKKRIDTLLNSLSSMEFLAYNLFTKKESAIGYKNEQQILNIPIFRVFQEPEPIELPQSNGVSANQGREVNQASE